MYERAFRRAQAQVPKGYTGQITWSEVDNRSFLRLAHGTLLGLMHLRYQAKGGKAAMALAQQMLAWCPMDNIGVRFLLGDIALLHGDHRTALQEYLKGAPQLSVPHLSSRLLKRGHLRCIRVNRDNVLRIFSGDDLNGRLLSGNAQARCAAVRHQRGMESAMAWNTQPALTFGFVK